MAQYEKYWGDQLLPKFVYDEWRDGCVGEDDHTVLASVSASSDHCEMLEESMDAYIGDWIVCTKWIVGWRFFCSSSSGARAARISG